MFTPNSHFFSRICSQSSKVSWSRFRRETSFLSWKSDWAICFSQWIFIQISGFPRLMTPWPLRRKGARWKRSDFIGKPSINGPFSMAMLNNQRVMYVNVMLVCWILIWDSWKIVRFQISIHSQFLWPFRWWFPNANRHGGCAWLYYNKPRKGAEIGKFSFSNQTLLIGKSHDNHLIIYRSRSITMTSLQHH